MEKKELYMIGNSHIDPVWFWNWEEGMQEVKATYASALARMEEYPEFRFTSTSTAFFEWIEGIAPEMFEQIRRRVAEGRWEITGGWFIEPDCILPCGEAFVRQGLYSQRYLQSRFGKISRIGSNVDSFGHNHILPQILKKSGMDSYVFMRPRLDTPVFIWESDDGSRVNAISLPAEYTTWFHEPTVKNIRATLERTEGYNRMPCCYGVGNHGGGPTIENIESILSLRDSFENTRLRFSTFTEFLKDMDRENLPVFTGPFEKVNEGCYSVDSQFKCLNRLAERRLIEADSLMSMAAMMERCWMKQTGEMERLWKALLFNEFHDTMGGTTIKSAREEAMMQMAGTAAEAGRIKALAIQHVASCLDTTGEGFPLLLFNTDSRPFDDYVETELEWFCQAPLKLLNPQGEEIGYQRIHTDAKVRHTNLGGRRRFVFRAQIPSFGFAVYRTLKEAPSFDCNDRIEIVNSVCETLENPYIKAVFDTATGQLTSLTDKATGYDALNGPCSIRVYMDERDDWGGLQGRRYEDTGREFRLVSIEKVESGIMRETIRVRLVLDGTTMEQLYSLGAEEKELRVENRLVFNHTWTLLKAAFTTGKACGSVLTETAYGTLCRKLRQGVSAGNGEQPEDKAKYYEDKTEYYEDSSEYYEDSSEYSMQRFLDVSDEEGRGLAIANDGKYAFNIAQGRTQITLCRSAIYAQGSSPDWYNEKESYQYTDIGPQTFRFVLKPHGNRLPPSCLYRIAKKINGSYEYLADSAHPGHEKATSRSFACVKPAETDCGNVRVMLVKKCEDDDAFIVRLLETDGKDTKCRLMMNGKEYPVEIGHAQIQTLKIAAEGNTAENVNLLEW